MPYCSSFLYRLLLGVSIARAVREMFQRFSLSFLRMKTLSVSSLYSCRVRKADGSGTSSGPVARPAPESDAAVMDPASAGEPPAGVAGAASCGPEADAAA